MLASVPKHEAGMRLIEKIWVLDELHLDVAGHDFTVKGPTTY